jgi:tellurite resistance protein TehA-like permease
MNEIEKKKWQEVRQKGTLSYVLKTSSIALFVIVLIYFFGNALHHKDSLKDYLEHNLQDNLIFNLAVIGLSYLIMVIMTFIVWFFNEKRYKKSIEDKKDA